MGSIRHRSGRRSALAGRLAVLAAVATLIATAYVLGAGPSSPVGAASRPASDSDPGAAIAPSSGYNPPCYAIASGICVSMANASQPNILPPTGSYVATSQPNPTININLYVKSHTKLDYSTMGPWAGPNSVMQLNVTAVSWNGNPYYSVYSGNVWHADNTTKSGHWWWPAANPVANASYPYWYNLEFTAQEAIGSAPNFYAGMHVTWWIAFDTYNGSVLTHWTSPTFQFTYAGAWAYSPYPGSSQYAGSGAASQDVGVSIVPQAPNWNDSVTATLNTTAADGPPVNATIGRAYWIVEEYTPNGSVLQAQTLTFPGSSVVSSTLGAPGESVTSITLPASWAQIQGATVDYQFVVYDTYDDRIATAPQSYTVGGNGSFSTGVFQDDLALAVAPGSVLTSSNATVAPGVAVPVTLTSIAPGTSILAAQLSIAFSYPALGETATTILPLVRERSTVFNGVIPPFPIGSQVSFSVEAWDFVQHEDVSSVYSFSVPTFSELVPVLPGNATFFYVYVFDNGTQSWVSGAHVQITGLSDGVNIETPTSYGVAYPNVSGEVLTPAIVPANSTYRISVLDPFWVPAGGLSGGNVSLIVSIPHVPTNRGPLEVGGDYWVVQEGNAFLFYLNATPPGLVAAPPATTSTGALGIAGLVGLIAGGLMAIPVYAWWRRVRSRRQAEEKRVTL